MYRQMDSLYLPNHESYQGANDFRLLVFFASSSMKSVSSRYEVGKYNFVNTTHVSLPMAVFRVTVVKIGISLKNAISCQHLSSKPIGMKIFPAKPSGQGRPWARSVQSFKTWCVCRGGSCHFFQVDLQ